MLPFIYWKRGGTRWILFVSKFGIWEIKGLLYHCIANDLKANAFTFSSAIKACERQGCWEAVSKLLLHMANGNVQGNSYTFNAAIGTFGKAQMWLMALSLAKEMTIQQIQSDMITGSTLVGSLEPWPNSGRASFSDEACQSFGVDVPWQSSHPSSRSTHLQHKGPCQNQDKQQKDHHQCCWGGCPVAQSFASLWSSSCVASSTQCTLDKCTDLWMGLVAASKSGDVGSINTYGGA